MLANRVLKTRIGLVAGATVQVGVTAVERHYGLASTSSAVYGTAIVGLLIWTWGCYNYAAGKGYPRWYWMLGPLCWIFGLLVLFLLPDKHKRSAIAIDQPAPIPGSWPPAPTVEAVGLGDANRTEVDPQ